MATGGSVALLQPAEADSWVRRAQQHERGIHPRQQETWFTDDRLRTLIGQVNSDRLLILLDCCHSGTGTRGFRERPPLPGERYVHLGFDRPERASRNFAISKAMRSVRAGGNHTLLAACSSDEVARDAGPQIGGIFTASLIGEASKSGGATLEEVMGKVIDIDHSRGRVQLSLRDV